MIALRHVCESAAAPCTGGRWHLAHDDGRTLCGEPAQPEPLRAEQINRGFDWLCWQCAELYEVNPDWHQLARCV